MTPVMATSPVERTKLAAQRRESFAKAAVDRTDWVSFRDGSRQLERALQGDACGDNEAQYFKSDIKALEYGKQSRVGQIIFSSHLARFQFQSTIILSSAFKHLRTKEGQITILHSPTKWQW